MSYSNSKRHTRTLVFGTLSIFVDAYILLQVLNLADAGEVLCGPIGREVFGASLVILLIFTSASHILTFTIALNVITQHATCTIVWSVVALAVFIVCCLPRTMKAVSYLSIAGMITLSQIPLKFLTKYLSFHINHHGDYDCHDWIRCWKSTTNPSRRI